ncbi:FTR1 family protein [Aggregatilinea lenta]|uniref:FTR1 family protein n=1 Tax=Aggregatilinea lenta TaxID=913108 RepID=UPI0013C2BBA9|nr:FTR1 family protein [Aggregatilinea lenta]
MARLTHVFNALIAVALVALLALAGLGASRVHADETAPWQIAGQIHDLTFDAQRALYAAAREDGSGTATGAVDAIEQAQALYDEALHGSLQALAPEADAQIVAGLDTAATAANSGDTLALAAARGQIWTGLLWGSYDAALATLEQGDLDAAREWLRLREYRQATTVNVVSSPAAQAITDLATGTTDAETALARVGNDLRDAYFFRLRDALNEAESNIERQFGTRAAEWTAQASGYFALLRPDAAAKLGEDAASAAAGDLAALEDAVRAEDWTAAARHLDAARSALSAYQPVELNDAEIQQRGGLLHLYVTLIYTEYKDGVRSGAISNEIEYREAVTFYEQARVVFEELQPALMQADSAAAEQIAALLDQIDAAIQAYDDKAVVEGLVNETADLVSGTLGVETNTNDLSATFVTLYSLLNDVVLHVQAGDYKTAEQVRVQAYAMFDAGPEMRLMAFSPQLGAEIDGLFWSGYGDHRGLAEALDAQAPAEEIEATRAALVGALKDAQLTIGDTSGAPLAIITNTAVIVFREGLEAVVILAALLASMVHRYREYRRPVALGVVLASIATLLTFVAAQSLLSSLRQYGEKLEAVVSVIAIGVLLLITNWFFHKVYWTDWLARFHRYKSKALKLDAGQYVALVTLGFTSVYREGFETVLFLQALTLDAGVSIVLQGVLLGLAGVLLAGYLTFRLQKHLPYMTMMVFTGVLIGGVLVTMVGHTVRVMQTVGWLPITGVGTTQFPFWAGQWLGLYATWEGLILQVGAGAFVIGSYYLAEFMKKRERAQHAQRRVADTQGAAREHGLGIGD